jgi:superfamily I DNA/RNA helicase
MVLATVHEFKGLEADVVVAADIAELHDSALRRHAYVACTRARTHLTAMLHEGVRSDYDDGARWFSHLLTSRTRPPTRHDALRRRSSCEEP